MGVIVRSVSARAQGSARAHIDIRDDIFLAADIVRHRMKFTAASCAHWGSGKGSPRTGVGGREGLRGKEAAQEVMQEEVK